MPTREARRTHVEEAGLWIARVRLVVVLFAVAEVGFRHDDYPSGYETRGRPCLRDRPAVDALEAANRCARTLPSSPDVSQAFAFAPEEVELVALLGRLVATAAQNIRAHEAEDETSRLASLVADVLDTSRIEAGTFTFTSGTSTWHSSCATSRPRPTWLRARCASGPR
jgi:hypothetical protein